ncbi:hypothetical protein [Desulfobacter hydrogenophilus]|nr:hypothetical protein [Desulfobacter hydrogenophilus]NDY74362.1 hypothetical protein [Desulfobacter hydrogenophilus]
MSDVIFMEKRLEGVEVEWKPLGKVVESLDSLRKIKNVYRTSIPSPN